MMRTLIRIADGIEYKTCGACGQEFPLDSEDIFVSYKPDGSRKIHGRCKSCNAKKNRTWFLMSLYGITPEDVDRMLAEQNGCALCHSPEPRTKKGLARRPRSRHGSCARNPLPPLQRGARSLWRRSRTTTPGG